MFFLNSFMTSESEMEFVIILYLVQYQFLSIVLDVTCRVDISEEAIRATEEVGFHSIENITIWSSYLASWRTRVMAVRDCGSTRRSLTEL